MGYLLIGKASFIGKTEFAIYHKSSRTTCNSLVPIMTPMESTKYQNAFALCIICSGSTLKSLFRSETRRIVMLNFMPDTFYVHIFNR